MHIKIINSYNLFFYESYVIAEAHKDAEVDSKLTEKITEVVLDYYSDKSFTLISHRKNSYRIYKSAYSPKNFNKIQRFAVVSKDKLVKERAVEEQPLFRNSFAFFEELDDAISWSLSH